MKTLIGHPFDGWRLVDEAVAHYGNAGGPSEGMFRLPGGLAVIATAGDGWDHVSVSLPKRCPTWDEMVFVKRAFFKDDEWAFELHPPPSANISNHPYCLHLWRPWAAAIPKPPDWMV